MRQLSHHQIMWRVGRVLLVLGLIDLAYTLWQAAGSGHFALKLNLVAIGCGAFLLKGSLRAAWITRWLAVIGVVALIGSVLVLPLGEPVSLTIAKFRLMTVDMLVATALSGALLALFAWVARELGKAPVRAATTESGRRWRGNGIPALLGVVLVAVMTVVVTRGLSGETRDRAIRMAVEKYGDRFSYTMSWHGVTHSSSGGTTRRAVVTAWNDGEILFINVWWNE